MADYGAENAMDGRFVRGEDRLGRLEVKVAALETQVQAMDNDLYNHGGPTGLKTQFTMFMAEHRGRQQQREREERKWRWVIGAILTAMLVVMAVLTWLETRQQIHEGKLSLPRISHSVNANPIFSARSKRDSGVPSNFESIAGGLQ